MSLAISRKVRESIQIGKDIEIVVIEILKGRVVLGINADRYKYPVTRCAAKPIPVERREDEPE